MKKSINKIFYLLFFLGTASMVFTSCLKEVTKEYKFSMSVEVGAITTNSASCGIRVIADAGSEDMYNSNYLVGCMWASNGYPTNYRMDTHSTTALQNSGMYNLQMTNLQPNTTYYVQGFVIRTPDGNYTDGSETVGDPSYGPVVTFTTSAATPNLQIVSLQVNGDLYQNQTGSFTATLKNTGTAAYNSDLWIYLSNPTTGAYQYLGGIISSIGAGVSKSITFTGTVTLSPGTYDCNVVFDANNDPNNPSYYLFNNVLGIKATVN